MTATTIAPAPTYDRAPTWTRLLLVIVGLPQFVVGLWAVAAPRSFFDDFPGFGPMLVAAEPPYNEHLVSDVGAGFLASGLFVLAAAAWGLRPLVFVASACLAAFAIPHFAFHAVHPAELLSAAENVVNVVVLGVAALAPTLVAIRTRPRRKGASQNSPRKGNPL